MLEIGRICVKIAGRDAGKKAIVIDVIDGVYVLVDGEVRRKKCNIKHLEPLEEKVEISKNASHSEILKLLGLEEKKKKEKKEKVARPRKIRTKKIKEEKK